MTRTTLTKTVAAGSVDYAGMTLTATAADTTDKNQFAASGNDLILAHNTGVTAYTVTVSSAPDPYGRTKDIDAVDVDADEILVIGPLKLTGWVQADGNIYVEANNVAVKFAIVQL